MCEIDSQYCISTLNAFNVFDINSFHFTRSTQEQNTQINENFHHIEQEKSVAQRTARSQRVKSCYAIESCLETDCLYQG